MREWNLAAGLLLLLFAVFASQAFAGIEGVYVIKTQTPMGEMESTLALNADGTGYIESMMGKTQITGAKIDGKNYEINILMDSPMGSMNLSYKGVVDGEKTSGIVAGGAEVGEMPYTGQKKPAAA
jgi:hypothetical protein